MSTLVTKSQYAAMRGWSAAYVSKLVKQGRVAFGPDGKSVNVEATDAMLDRTADPAKHGVREHWARERGGLAVDEPLAPAGGDQPGDDSPSLSGYDYKSAVAKKVTHEARIAELKELQLAGSLVDKQEMLRAAQDNATAMRAALERIPDRLSTQLAAETDPDRVYALLINEVEHVCEELRTQALVLAARIVSEVRQ